MSRAVTAEAAKKFLIAGNERFFNGESHFRNALPEELERLYDGQSPFATIIGCSDSRVPPEIIFDAYMGEIFVIRIAGNILSSEIAGSLQYAGARLRTPLFLVLGHTDCGAVHAALEYRSSGISHASRIQVLVDRILPALDGIDPNAPKCEQILHAVETNVRWTMKQILDTEAGLRVALGEFTLVGGVYEMKVVGLGYFRKFDILFGLSNYRTILSTGTSSTIQSEVGFVRDACVPRAVSLITCCRVRTMTPAIQVACAPTPGAVDRRGRPRVTIRAMYGFHVQEEGDVEWWPALAEEHRCRVALHRARRADPERLLL